ncbi:MAG: alpha-amylase family glycosyl hydrolase [Cyclobacteriaceae bacterium]
MNRILLIFILFSCVLFAKAQEAITPTITPDFFTPEDEITISYKVSASGLSNLSEAWLWLWLPDLTDVDVPSNVNPADSNPDLTNKAKFTREVKQGLIYFSITLKLTEFTNKPASEIKKVGVLLKGNDWSDGQTADHVFDIPEGFSLKVNSPTQTSSFYEAGEKINIDVATSEAATISVTLDNETLITETDAASLVYDHEVVADGEVHELVVSATNGTDTDSFKHTYSITPTPEEAPVPAGLKTGINYYDEDPTKATLVLMAPNKDNVFVLGDFNGWELNQNYLMKKDGDRFWLTIENLTSGQEYIYQYLIDGEITISDPYSEKVSSSYDDPEIISENRYPGLLPFPSDYATQEATYLQPGKPDYQWEVTDFDKPASEDLVIYELLIRDFTEERTYKSITERLDYFDSLGFNAIELMPVTEFEGNLSWGYNPSYMFAPDKYYGTEDDLKELIDEAHKRGIAIIFDMVLNHHFGRSPMVKMYASGDFGPPTAENVWFNITPKHDYNVGYDMNHESTYTQEYFKDVVRYWIEEYKVDGYRFDLSKGFTQKNTLGDVGGWGAYDITRINIWNKYAGYITDVDEDAYIILEHFADNSEEKALAAKGMMLWGNMNHQYRSTAKSNSDNLFWLYHEDRDWTSQGVVGYMESHDEERVMWDALKTNKPLGYLINRLELNAAFFFLVPGPKMVWQFGETGYDEELNNDRLGIKPTHWEYLEDPDRIRLFAMYQSLINLKTKTDYLDNQYFDWKSTGSVKWINYDHPDLKISVVGNFGKGTLTEDPHFVEAGDWYDYFTGEKITVTDPNEPIELLPGEFRIYVSEQIENYITINPVNLITGFTSVNRELEVYPNPTTEGFSIKSVADVEEIRIYSLSGHLVYKSVRPTGKMSIGHLDSGIYLYEITTKQNLITRGKIIKQ